MRHCERLLAHLPRNNTSVTGALARQVWQAELVRVPVDGIAVREAEDECVTDIAAVLVVGKEKAVIEERDEAPRQWPKRAACQGN
jgi:actin-related protein 9